MVTDSRTYARAEGLDELLKVLRTLPREASADLRTRVQALADRHAEHVRAALRRQADPRSRALAVTVRARRDRTPVVVLGGARRTGVSGGARAGELLYGMEFGADPDGPNGWRFPDRVPEGRVVFPALAERHPQLVREWQETYRDVVRAWTTDGRV